MTSIPRSTPEPGTPVIRVIGASEHNLDHLSVDIPRNRLTVITGVSGSGKSSLAFDTIYAEGQRRYVESLSTHARQFLEQMQKPAVDRIEGLTPTTAIEQRLTASGPRSTVATVTEIHDFLRVLFARAGTPHCWECDRVVTRQSTARIVDVVLGYKPGQRILVLAPLVHRQRGSHVELLAKVMKQGFVRARVDGEPVIIEELEMLPPQRQHTIEVVVDRLAVKPEIAQRLADSVEVATRVSGGRVIVSREAKPGAYEDEFFSSAYACPVHPDVNIDELSPAMFSFNSPHGACPVCGGLGGTMEFDSDLVIPDADLSLAEGGVAAWRGGGKQLNAVYAKMVKEFCERFDVLPAVPIRNISDDRKRILLHGTSKGEAAEHGAAFEGVLPNLRRRWNATDSESVKHRLHAFRGRSPCEVCHGARLRPESLAVTVGGANLADVCRMTLDEARAFFDELNLDGEAAVVAAPLLREIRRRLQFINDVGVEYLTLDRAADTLSGGEAQRLRLATQIGSRLVGVCFVLDEPTIGLHPRDTGRLIGTLTALTAEGNTVIVVEHDDQMIRAADYILDLGPGAGERGGKIVVQGSLDDVLKCDRSITARYLTGAMAIPVPPARRPTDWSRCVEVRGVTANNLKGIDVRFPLGCFICVTGVSGSGKSTLVTQVLLRALKRKIDRSGPKPGPYRRIVGSSLVDRMIQIDQTPLGKSPRSNPATYIGALDPIRELFARTREAKLRGYTGSRFSFNVKGGRCDECQGQGTKRIEMHFLPDVFVTCEGCQGRRYNRETLEVRYRGKNIADVLDMRVEQAVAFFSNFTRIRQLIGALKAVGLGYLTLGQPSDTLSGGEAQRVNLAAELGKTPLGHTMYILNEPTRGLHSADVHTLLGVLSGLLSKGHTVVVIEHNLDVIKSADWVIDLGPEGGEGGGHIVVEGTPEEVARCEASHTGRVLGARLAVAGAPSL